MNPCTRSRRTVAGLAILLTAVPGCQSAGSSAAKREARMPHGYIYYCDGAGGGGFMNWAGGLRKGLIQAGYQGDGEIFKWNTGLGVVPDQDASVHYKRDKAHTMAREAAAYARTYPNAPLSFVGLSAGTTVVVYALEQLPQDAPVDNVVLCGASISSTYDLTRALRNVKGKIYVFTSEKDSVLGFLVPMAGTADRASGNVPSAGLRGFRMPRGATTDTRQQYAKVVTIPWRHEFAKLGYRGGHTDVLSARFVAAHIAPRLTQHIGSTPRALASTRGKVRNPDYERWADFGVGSFVVLEGHQEFQGKRTPVRLRSILMRKSADRLLIERQQYLAEGDGEIPEQIHSLIAEAWIDPRHHPTTDPTARITERPARRVSIGGRVFNCNGMSIAAPGEYPDWGSNVKATPYRCTDLPGGLVELELESHLQGQPFKFSGKVVRFNIVPDSDGK